MKNLVLFASGTGSNAENIILFFDNSTVIRVAAVVTNNPSAGVIEKAMKHDVPVLICTKEGLANGTVLQQIDDYSPDLIVLAGFLLKLPAQIVDAYEKKIINIHPALLPKHGGKGMYGLNIHKAVLESNETETGISIHYVDQHYDNGDLILQERIPIDDCQTPEEIAAKIQHLEHKHLPLIIAQLLN